MKNVDHIPAIIMNGFTNQQILAIMKAVKSLPEIPPTIFGTSTETNLDWKLGDLITELANEHEEMKKLRQLREAPENRDLNV